MLAALLSKEGLQTMFQVFEPFALSLLVRSLLVKLESSNIYRTSTDMFADL